MNKLTQAFMCIALAASLLAGCGQTEGAVMGGSDTTGDDGSDTGTTGTTSDSGSADAGRDGDAGTSPTPDAGTPSPDAGMPDAGTPTPDAGSRPPVDAGTSPTPDAGTPSPDAGMPDAGTPTPDAGPTPHSAPVRSPACNRLEFSDEYVGGSACGEVRGALPGVTWSTGPTIQDTDADHFLEYAPPSIAAGTYEFTYVAKTCGGSVGAWADYGSRSLLLGMTPDARSFVNCNWWDSATGTVVSVGSPGCNLRITVDGSGNVTGAGNMRDYH